MDQPYGRRKRDLPYEGSDRDKQRIERLRARGVSDESIAAGLVIDGSVIDRMKRAGFLGLLDRNDPKPRHTWTRIELLHAVEFALTAMADGPVSVDALRSMFEEAIVEVQAPLKEPPATVRD